MYSVVGILPIQVLISESDKIDKEEINPGNWNVRPPTLKPQEINPGNRSVRPPAIKTIYRLVKW